MQLFRHFIPLILFCINITSIAQNNTAPKWMSMQFSNKVSLQTALIKIDNKNSTYADLLNLPDSSILKVEFYAKKQAQQIVDKDEAKNGLVLVTLHKKHFPYPPAKKDSVVFIIENDDTIFCEHAQPAMLGDTTNAQWFEFLRHSLKAAVPADNDAPPGVYFVDMVFLVKKDGTVSEVSVVEDPGYGTGAEVKRLMSQSPAWMPAKCDDTPVNYRQRERITFMVSEE